MQMTSYDRHLEANDLIMVHVHSQGKDAAFPVHKHDSACLMRPGALDYRGPADRWAAAVLCKDIAPLKRERFRVPLEYGLIALDYDAKVGRGHSVSIAPFSLNLFTWERWTGNAARPERKWLQDLAKKGYLRTIQWPDGRTTRVAIPDPDVLYTALWLQQEAHRQEGLPLPKANDLSAGPLVAKLEVPGWAFHDYNRHPGLNADGWLEFRKDLAAEAAFSTQETKAWRLWADRQEKAAVVSALEAERLDTALLECATGRRARRM